MPITYTNKYCIAIKTSCGSIGMGHIQRMTSLLRHLNEAKEISTFIIPDMLPEPFPEEMRKYFRSSIDFLPDLIIRDMRDSSGNEINELKKTGRVLCVDDNGPGSLIADYAIDILPNPDVPDKERLKSKAFLYGYNFIKALEELKGKRIPKELDFAIYPGSLQDKKYIGYLVSLLPENSSYSILTGGDSYSVRSGHTIALPASSHAGIILSSKIVISHFGITLYEGQISGCGLISVNPTDYHSRLSDTAKDTLDVVNLGVFNKIDRGIARELLKKTLIRPRETAIDVDIVYKNIIDQLDDFSNMLIRLIQDKGK